MAQVLVVDDEKNVQKTLSITLSRAGHMVDVASSGEEAVDKVSCKLYDLVVTDLRMGDTTGLGVLEAVKERDEETEVILMSAFGSVGSAVTAMRGGACDYLEKPFDAEALLYSVNKALERRSLRSQVRTLQRAIQDPNDPERIVGEAAKMRHVMGLVSDWAQSKSTILITGETGTGKDMVARAIHRESPRADRPFTVVNCATIPRALFESEIFGHVKGAYSGASRNRKGLAHEAHGGTLFLDEIGELPLEVQPQLLRFLELGEIRPVGQNSNIIVDVRVVAATNRDLRARVGEGAFREDLYYRLNVLPLELPPLRERKSDIPAIVALSLKRFARRLGRPLSELSAAGLAHLEAYDWPGNVRELQNVIERGVMLSRGAELAPEHLLILGSAAGAARELARGGVQLGDALSAAEIERHHIVAVLKGSGGNQRQAAKVLQISKSTLWRKLKEYGVEARDL